MPGSGGRPVTRNVIRNGVMLNQAEPSNVSTSKPAGRRAWITPGSNGQWRKVRDNHCWLETGRSTRSSGRRPAKSGGLVALQRVARLVHDRRRGPADDVARRGVRGVGVRVGGR